MKKLIKLFFTASVIFSLLSCNDHKAVVNVLNISKGNEIMPLSIGNKWEYKEYEFDDDKLLTTHFVDLEVVNKIFVKENGKKIEVFKLKETRILDVGTTLELYFLLRPKNDTIYWYGHAVENNDDYYFKKIIYMKYPIEVGENWLHDNGDYYHEFTCDSINEKIIINNTNYGCIKIREGADDYWSVNTYYSKGIGVVYEERRAGWHPDCNLVKQILIRNVIVKK